ncbi:growth hormone secretagogue receptor type 1-like [Lineus longissimus]|uniref:growth hormone secretagogue receptor type 1-like n=1 Tax=Lineus longissimus TaxID=88925 RepID=UPI002B4D92B7
MTLNHTNLVKVLPQTYLALDLAYYVIKHWAIYGIFTFGFVGNTISFLITNKKEYRHVSTGVYMTSLAVLDNACLLVMMMYNMLSVQRLGDGIQDRQNFHVWFVFFNFSCQYASRLLLAAMTADRAYKVLFPLRAKSTGTTSKTKKVIIVVTLIPAIANINFFFTIKVLFIRTDDETPAYSFPEVPWIELMVTGWTLFIAVILPFFTILTSNILIIYGVQRAASARTDMVSVNDKAKENHLTRMLILVSVAYIILCLPDAVNELVFSIPEVSSQYVMSSDYWRTRAVLIGWTLAQVSAMNHAVNFFLYVLGGGKTYRQDVKKLFTGCLNQLPITKQ